MEGTYTLESAALRAVFTSQGAQLISLRDKSADKPILWEGDPAVWRESAPWLFPIIGQLKDGRFISNGAPYAMPMHGFAKRMAFETAGPSGDSITFTLRDDDQTLKVYPYHFELAIRYRLTDSALTATVTVKNAGEGTMYYSLGAHPGLICDAGDKLVFDGQAELTCRRLYQENHLMKKERFTTPLEDASLTLRADLFKEDALLVEAPAFTAITLRRAAGRDVKFTFDPVPWLGLWSRYLESGEVKYICLEPWLGVDDICDADGLIEHKVGIQALSPGQARAFTISIEPK